MKSTKETLTFLIILIIPLVLGYNLHSWAWEGGTGEQYYEKKGEQSFPDQRHPNAFEEAAATWSAVEGFQWPNPFLGNPFDVDLEEWSNSKYDGINGLYYVEDLDEQSLTNPSNTAIADFKRKLQYTENDTFIVESDIAQNANVLWTNDPDDENNRYDIESNALHELGHSAGIDHPNEEGHVMTESLESGMKRRELTNDDESALQFKYPPDICPGPCCNQNTPSYFARASSQLEEDVDKVVSDKDQSNIKKIVISKDNLITSVNNFSIKYLSEISNYTSNQKISGNLVSDLNDLVEKVVKYLSGGTKNNIEKISAKLDTLEQGGDVQWKSSKGMSGNEIVEYLNSDSKDREHLFTTEAFPNPTTGRTKLKISTDEGNEATIKVYDILGRTVLTREEFISRGKTIIKLRTDRLISGKYFVRTTVGSTTVETKLNVVN